MHFIMILYVMQYVQKIVSEVGKKGVVNLEKKIFTKINVYKSRWILLYSILLYSILLTVYYFIVFCLFCGA